MRFPLLAALLFAVPWAPAGAQVPDDGASPDWGQGFQQTVQTVFTSIVKDSGLLLPRTPGGKPPPPPTLFFYANQMVTYDCKKGAIPGSANAAAERCGDKSVIVYGTGLLEMSQGCDWLGVSKESTLAFWLAHETAHHVMDHHGCREEDIRKVCDAWIKKKLATDKGTEEVTAIAAKVEAETPGDETAKRSALIHALAKRCGQEAKDALGADATRYEQEADREGLAHLQKTPYASTNAGECAFLRANQWMTAAGIRSVGPHDPLEKRSVDAKALGEQLQRLGSVAPR